MEEISNICNIAKKNMKSSLQLLIRRNKQYLQYSKEEYEKLTSAIDPKDIEKFKKLKYVSSIRHPKVFSYSGLLAIVYQFKYCKDIIVETEKIIIDLDIKNYESFMLLKSQTSVLRLRIKEIEYQGDYLFTSYPGYKIMDITEFEPCDRSALLIFRFLMFTNLASTLEEIIFLSGLNINLDLLGFLIMSQMNRKINLQFYEYLSTKLLIE